MAKGVEPAQRFVQMFEFLIILAPELAIHLSELYSLYLCQQYVNTFTASSRFEGKKEYLD